MRPAIAWGLFILTVSGAATAGPGQALRAVDEPLEFLARSQAEDGGWRCSVPASAEAPSDPTLTGTCLLVFLDAGYTHRGKHPYAATVSRGLRFLKRAQGEDGWFTKAPDRSLGDHLPPALAMLEAFGMTQSLILKRSCVSSLAVVRSALAANDPYLKRPEVAGWALLMLHSARRSDQYRASREPPQSRLFVIEDEALAPLRCWRDVDPGDEPLRQSVVVMAGMLFEKDEAFDNHLRKVAERIGRSRPSLTSKSATSNPLAWFFANRALTWTRVSTWRDWNRAFLEFHGAARVEEPEALKGSMDPGGLTMEVGGPIRLTALAAVARPAFCTCYAGRPRTLR